MGLNAVVGMRKNWAWLSSSVPRKRYHFDPLGLHNQKRRPVAQRLVQTSGVVEVPLLVQRPLQFQGVSDLLPHKLLFLSSFTLRCSRSILPMPSWLSHRGKHLPDLMLLKIAAKDLRLECRALIGAKQQALGRKPEPPRLLPSSLQRFLR